MVACHCVVCVRQNLITTTFVGALVSEARLAESSSSGSDTDSTEQHQSQGMTHGRLNSLHVDWIFNTI